MALPFRPRPRRINISSANKPQKTVTATPKETQELYYVRLVERNVKYTLILQSLRDGITPSVIATHFANQQWIAVNERTFAEAIRTFRRVKPEALSGTNEGLSSHIDPNVPSMSPEAQVNQLIRLQAERLAIQYANEKNLGTLFNSTYRDVEAMGKLVELRAKINGVLKDNGQLAPQSADPTVHEDLHRVKKENVTADRLHLLTKQLVGGTS